MSGTQNKIKESHFIDLGSLRKVSDKDIKLKLGLAELMFQALILILLV